MKGRCRLWEVQEAGRAETEDLRDGEILCVMGKLVGSFKAMKQRIYVIRILLVIKLQYAFTACPWPLAI